MRRQTGAISLPLVSLVTGVLILLSIRYLDRPLAVWFMRLLDANRLLRRASANIPDTLLLLVCSATVILWLIYFFLRRRHGYELQRQFLKVAASALPLAFLLKTVLQFVFGRTNTRLWLSGKPLAFNWFHGAGIGCFPSGHMTVFTALFVAICYYQHRLCKPAVVLLLVLALLLVATAYHFLSDVIAGALLGVLVTHGVRRLLAGDSGN